MKSRIAVTIALGASLAFAVCAPALAGVACTDCGKPLWAGDGGCCELCDGSGNFIDVALYNSDVADNQRSFNQYGQYPIDWAASARLNAGDACSKARFELRLRDLTSEDGSAWARFALDPVSFDSNHLMWSGWAWDAYGPDAVYNFQEVAKSDVQMRIHSGEFDNMLFSYENADFDRDANGSLSDFSVRRLAGQWNFGGADGRLRGQLRHTGSAIDAPRVGADGNLVDTTALKLDACLSDEFSAYGNLSLSTFKYDNLPDDSMSGSDYRIGLRYAPRADWELDASYRAKANPDDNTVSSHVDGLAETSLSVGYAPCGSTRIEAGYKHREVDYASLNMRDANVLALLRSGSAVTPADVAAATTVSSPVVNETWIDYRRNLTEELLFRSRLDFSDGDSPGTALVAAGSPGLFYEKQLTRTHGFGYCVDECNQLELNVQSRESSNDQRGSDFDLQYLETSWLHRFDSGGALTLGWRSTEADLTATGVPAGYTTDDITYAASWCDEWDACSYQLDLSVSDGTGAEEYTQTGAGASFRFDQVCPLGFRVDWYDRSYKNLPAFDASALSFGVDYRINF